MFKAGFVSLQDIPRDKDHAPSRTIYTWRANNDVAVGQMGGDIYKSALNTRLFYEHHFEANKQVSPNQHMLHDHARENAGALPVRPAVTWCWRNMLAAILASSAPCIEGWVRVALVACPCPHAHQLLCLCSTCCQRHGQYKKQGGITALQLMEKVKKDLANDQDREDCETVGQQLRIVVSKGLAIDRQIALMNDY